jgi:hypothetical protein
MLFFSPLKWTCAIAVEIDFLAGVEVSAISPSTQPKKGNPRRQHPTAYFSEMKIGNPLY